MNLQQEISNSKTVLQYDKKAFKCTISLRNDKEEDLSEAEFRVTKIQLKCKPSLQKMILHDFLQRYSSESCQANNMTQQIKIKVVRKYHVDESYDKNEQKGQIVKIDCEGNDHVFYLSSLIRSVWQKKTIPGQLKIEDILDSSLLYMQQFQLDISDLIQVFEAPLTQQYSRL